MLSKKVVLQYVETIRTLQKMGHKLVIIVGGGAIARDYIKTAATFHASKSILDRLGIESARQNARLLQSAFPDSYPHPPTSFEDLQTALLQSNLVFVGGLQPGQSTNAVAALAAELLQADYLFNISDVDYVYDRDPREHTDAKKMLTLSYDTLTDIILQNSQDPGMYDLFDLVATQIIKRSKIKLSFVNGKHPDYILRILDGEALGSLVYDA